MPLGQTTHWDLFRKTIIRVRHPSQVSRSGSLLFRFGRQYSRHTHFKLWFETEGCHWDCQTIKVKVASESESDLHIQTIGIGQEFAHKHIQLRRNTFLQTVFSATVKSLLLSCHQSSSSSPSSST